MSPHPPLDSHVPVQTVPIRQHLLICNDLGPSLLLQAGQATSEEPGWTGLPTRTAFLDIALCSCLDNEQSHGRCGNSGDVEEHFDMIVLLSEYKGGSR